MCLENGATESDLKKWTARLVALWAVGKLARGLQTFTAVLVATGLLATAFAQAALAQAQPAPAKTGIEDTWQGTLQAGPQNVRIVVKIAKTDPSGLKVTLFNADQGGRGQPASSASFEGGVLKYAIEFAGVSYEGKMAADKQSIAGTWKTSAASFPFVLERATQATEWAIPEAAAATQPMAANANPSFEVATIKPSKPDTPGRVLTVRGTRVIAVNMTMVALINQAYGIQTKQIVNAPPWMESDKFDITAQPDTPGVPSVEQIKIMIQKLLADRLQMKFHREQREMAAYILTVAKNGPKLKKNEDDPSGLPSLFFQQLGVLSVHNATIAEFAGIMQSAVLDRPVVDQTGLQGKWDFILKWTPDESQFAGLGIKVPPPSEAADAPPPLFTAIQEQIGLKLNAEKAPVPVLVIDHIEKPSEN
jgi:uncharacterized protein (TIGR03435 family)